MKLLKTVNGEKNKIHFYKIDIDDQGPYLIQRNKTERIYISLDNFRNLMKETVIMHGECQSGLVYIENNFGQLELVKKNGERYKQAEKSKLTLRDINIGDEVTLLDYSDTFIYLGSFYENIAHYQRENIVHYLYRVFVCLEERRVYISEKTPVIFSKGLNNNQFSSKEQNLKLLKNEFNYENGFGKMKQRISFKNSENDILSRENHVVYKYSIQKLEYKDFRREQ